LGALESKAYIAQGIVLNDATSGDRGRGSINVSKGYYINNIPWLAGSGTPEGNVAAGIGSLWSRTDGGAGTALYVKESGTSSTGWSALAAPQSWLLRGADSPEGAVTASIGSLFLRTNGGAGTTLYIKESGAGNTGWAAK
jgi:hypothetical protein